MSGTSIIAKFSMPLSTYDYVYKHANRNSNFQNIEFDGMFKGGEIGHF